MTSVRTTTSLQTPSTSHFSISSNNQSPLCLYFCAIHSPYLVIMDQADLSAGFDLLNARRSTDEILNTDL